MDVARFARKEPLLVISLVVAVLSLFLVPFDSVLHYDYMRIFRTIGILLTFLLIVAGLSECNALKKLAEKVLENKRNTRSLYLSLILLPFFCAMLFSNDVSLFTFVPLAIIVLKTAGLKRNIPAVLILQTAAANIGSSMTPFGNPHNIYMYNTQDLYGFTLLDYESALAPIVVIGAVVLLAMVLLLKNDGLDFRPDDDTEITGGKSLYVIVALFILAIVCTLDVIPWYVGLVVVMVVFAVMMRSVFRRVNYSILFVFFFLFVFANDIANVESVSEFLVNLMGSDPMLTTVGLSQLTSNVSSTIILQPFTMDWRAVLVGADIGGFGTPVASMASLITLQFYMREKDADLNRYFKMLILINAVVLAALIPTYYIFG